MRPLAIVTTWLGSVSVCLLDTMVNLTKTDEPIEMRFGKKTRLGPRNDVLYVGPERETDNFGGFRIEMH